MADEKKYNEHSQDSPEQKKKEKDPNKDISAERQDDSEPQKANKDDKK